MENDIDKNCKKLIEKGNEFIMKGWYYKRIIKYLGIGEDVLVFLK